MLLLRRWSETERRPYCEERDISWKSKETDFVETENQCFQTNMMNVAIVIPTWQSSVHLTGRHVSIYFHRVPMLNFSGRDFVRPYDETYKIWKFWPPSLAGLTCYQFVRAKRFTKRKDSSVSRWRIETNLFHQHSRGSLWENQPSGRVPSAVEALLVVSALRMPVFIDSSHLQRTFDESKTIATTTLRICRFPWSVLQFLYRGVLEGNWGTTVIVYVLQRVVLQKN